MVPDSLIESHMRSIEWLCCRWLLVTPNRPNHPTRSRYFWCKGSYFVLDGVCICLYEGIPHLQRFDVELWNFSHDCYLQVRIHLCFLTTVSHCSSFLAREMSLAKCSYPICKSVYVCRLRWSGEVWWIADWWSLWDLQSKGLCSRSFRASTIQRGHKTFLLSHTQHWRVQIKTGEMSRCTQVFHRSLKVLEFFLYFRGFESPSKQIAVQARGRNRRPNLIWL